MKKRNYNALRWLWISALIWLTAVSSPAQEQVLDLNQIVAMALARNPELAVAKFKVDASEAVLTQAKSAYFPQINSEAGVSRQRLWIRGPQTEGIHDEYNAYDLTLGAQQKLYDFGKTRHQVAAGRHSLKASRLDLAGSTADVIFAIKDSYFDVLKKYRLVDVNQEALDTQQKHLEETRAYYKAGVRPKIDVTTSEVEYANNRLDLIRAEFDLNIAIVNLENILGGPPVAGDYVLKEISAPATRLDNAQALIQTAMTGRPEIESLKDRIKASQAQVDASRAQYYPSLNAGGYYGWGNRDMPLRDSWQAGLFLEWPLFTGFRTKGELLEAKANLNQLKSRLKQLELEVVREVSQAVIGVNQIVEAIKTTEIAVVQAKENMELAQGRYKVGVGSVIEYNDAQLNLTRAKSNLIQSLFSHLQAMAALERAVGRDISGLVTQ
jgi:outer membrane protein